MMNERKNGGNKERHAKRETKERKVKFRKKRRERKHKTAEEINDDENTSSFHSSLLVVRLSR